MLAIHSSAQDYHHAWVRDHNLGYEGPIYNSLVDASADNHGSNCYILASSVDPLWLVVRGRRPTNVRNVAAQLDDWFQDITVCGRIERERVEGR